MSIPLMRSKFERTAAQGLAASLLFTATGCPQFKTY